MDIEQFEDESLCMEVDRLPLIGAVAAAQVREDARQAAREAARANEKYCPPCPCECVEPDQQQKRDWDTISAQHSRVNNYNEYGEDTLTLREMRRGS